MHGPALLEALSLPASTVHIKSWGPTALRNGKGFTAMIHDGAQEETQQGWSPRSCPACSAAESLSSPCSKCSSVATKTASDHEPGDGTVP